MQQPVLRVAYTRGVTPAKWARVWAQRRPDLPLELVQTEVAGQLDEVRDGRAHLAFVRLPIEVGGLHVIPLYEERPVFVVAADHVLAAAEGASLAEIDELAGGPVRVFDAELDAELDDAIALTAAGVGALVVPHSIARLHARKDLVAREVSDGTPTRVALVWPADGIRTTDEAAAIEEFVGVVRGRTANSSRGASTQPEAAAAPAKTGTTGKTGSASKAGTAAKRTTGERTGEARPRYPRRGGAGGRAKPRKGRRS